MITDDKKSILERVNFFCAFFIWSDPGGFLASLLLLQAVLAQGSLLDELRGEEDQKKKDIQPKHDSSVPSPD